MAATTQKLNYSEVSPRASSSRAVRTETVPTNGSNFSMGQEIIIDVPANLNNTFCDFQSSYIKASFENNNGADVKFSAGGFPTCIKQIILELGGQTLFSCDNWNTLYEMMLSLDTSESFRKNAGERLFGAGDDFDGATVAAGKARQVCFPLVLTPLMANRYFPLIGRDRLRIRLVLDTSARSLLGAATDVEINVTNVALVTYNLELGADVMAQVAANSDGSFKMLMPSYQHHQSSLSTSETSKVMTLGFSMSSLNRILVAQTRQTATAANAHIGNRARNRLNRYFLTIGGVKYPMRDIRDVGASSNAAALGVGAGSEPLAEALISQRALCAWSHDSSIAADGGFDIVNGAGDLTTTTGSYLIEIDLESQRVAGGEGSLGLVAGINTIGQVCQLTMEYDAVPGNAMVIDVFAEHTLMVALDLQSLTYSISV
jgi:hypothetical protein